MLRQIQKRKSQATMEYVILVIFILGAFIVFQKYIVRGFMGRWKDVGDSFGAGRQFSPQLTQECIFDYVYTNRWYNLALFEANNCDCLSVRATTTTCRDCILNSVSPMCDS